MIKPALLVRLIKQRIDHNEAYLRQGTAILRSLDIPVSDLDKTPGYRKAICEEIAFLKALIHECENPMPGAAR